MHDAHISGIKIHANRNMLTLLTRSFLLDTIYIASSVRPMNDADTLRKSCLQRDCSMACCIISWTPPSPFLEEGLGAVRVEDRALLASHAPAIIDRTLLRLFLCRAGVEPHSVLGPGGPDNRIALVVVGENDSAVGSSTQSAGFNGLPLGGSLGLMARCRARVAARRAGNRSPCPDPIPGIFLRCALPGTGDGSPATYPLITNRVLARRAAPFRECRTDVQVG